MTNQQNKIMKPILISIVLAAVICAVLLVMLLANGFKSDIFANDVDNNDTSLPSRLSETPDYGQFYLDNIIFIGDRTISAMRDLEILSDGADTKQIWTGEDDTLSLDYKTAAATIIFPENEEILKIADAIEKKYPDYVIITLGFDNGVAYCTEEKFKEYYGNLVTAIKEKSPNTKIILQSIFPVSDKKQKDNSGITNEKINRANVWIESLAYDHSARYLDTISILKDEKGNLKPEYDSGDGYTLNAGGYSAVLNYIRTHGYK